MNYLDYASGRAYGGERREWDEGNGRYERARSRVVQTQFGGGIQWTDGDVRDSDLYTGPDSEEKGGEDE